MDLHELSVLAAIRHGQRKAGVEKGPKVIFRALDRDISVITIPDDEDIVGYDYAVDGGKHSVFSPSIVGSFTQKLFEKITVNASFEEKFKVLTIGGDHSLAIGSVTAMAVLCKRSKRFSDCEPILFWIDAHADINTPSSSSTGSLHGCPVSLLAGLEKDSWLPVSKDFQWFYEVLNELGTDKIVSSSSIVYIGLRDVDEFEEDLLKNHDIIQYPMDSVKRKNRNMKLIIEEALSVIDPMNKRPIHLSFDIDAIDPKWAPSTGTPVRDGLTVEEGVLIIETLKSTDRLVSMDLVEVNPEIGTSSDQKITLDSSLKLLKSYFA